MPVQKLWGDERERMAGAKKVFIPLFITLMGILIALLIYFTAVYPYLDTTLTGKAYLFGGGEYPSDVFTNEEPIEQMLRWDGPLNGFGIKPGVYTQFPSEMHIAGRLFNTDTQETLTTFDVPFYEMTPTSFLLVPFEEPVHLSGQTVLLQFHFTGLSETQNMTLRLTDTQFPCWILGQEQRGSLSLMFCGDSSFMTAYYWPIAAGLVLLAVVLWVMLFWVRAKPQNVFLVAALMLGFLFTFAFPPYSGNDDVSHINTAFYHTNRLFGGEKPDKDGFFEMRAEDTEEGFTYYQPKRDNYYHIYQDFWEKESDPGATIEVKARVAGMVYQYIPQILGLSLARLLGLGQVATLYFGQWLSLLAYTGILYCTVRLVPAAFKTLFCLSGLIPFALQAAGGYSYDTSIIELCFFFTGYVLYICYDRPKLGWRDILILAAAGLLLAPLKYIYIPLLILPLIVPREKWAHPIWKTLFCALLGVCGALVLGRYVYYAVVGQYDMMTAEVGVTPWLDPEGGYTFVGIMQTPLEFLRLLGATAVDQLGELLTGMGAIQYNNIPLWALFAMAILLVLSVCPAKGQPVLTLRPSQRLVVGLSFTGVYLLALVAAVTWTYIGSYYIRGAQGRYFMGVLPLLALLFYGKLERRTNCDRGLVYAMGLLDIYCVMYLLLAGFHNRMPPRIF